MPLLRINLPPPITRGLLLLNLLSSALNAALRLRKWTATLGELGPGDIAKESGTYLSNPRFANLFLVLVPMKSLKFPWTFLTASFVENNIVSLAVSLCVLWFVGRYLERAWGTAEYGKFMLFVTIIPNFAAFCVYVAWHVVTGTPGYPTPIQGLVALEASFLVALKQLVPEHTVSLFRGTLRVRVKHFPALFTLANMVSGPLLGTDTALWLSLFGFLTSWVYLRFFRIQEIVGAEGEDVKMRGDASDTFSFVAFFPDALHPVLAPVSETVHNVLVQAKLFTPFSDEAVASSNESAAARSEGLPGMLERGGGVSGGRRAEAERRRALALKALDQRLNAAAAKRVSSAPAGTTVHAAVAAPATTGDMPDMAAGTVAGAEEAPVEAQE